MKDSNKAKYEKLLEAHLADKLEAFKRLEGLSNLIPMAVPNLEMAKTIKSGIAEVAEILLGKHQGASQR